MTLKKECKPQSGSTGRIFNYRLLRSFDTEGKPLDLQYLTEKADLYRLHYTFPPFAEDVPEAVRDK